MKKFSPIGFLSIGFSGHRPIPQTETPRVRDISSDKIIDYCLLLQNMLKIFLRYEKAHKKRGVLFFPSCDFPLMAFEYTIHC